MTLTHPFDGALALDSLDDHTRRGRTHPEWANMVGPFGGITTAILLRAIETHPDRIGEPLAVTVNFAGPIADGEFDISLRVARTNRTNQHWILQLSQDADIKTTATAVFAIRRDTWGDTEACAPSTPPPERLDAAGSEIIVTWGRLYDMRFTEGRFPVAGDQPTSTSPCTLWVRDRARRPVDYPALAALCDVFYPRVFRRLGGVLPAGTISMTTYFHANQQQLDDLGGDYVLATAHANRFAHGHFDQSAQIWTRDGTLLATTHQIVYYKG
jgi:acyl-CoA thioesterase